MNNASTKPLVPGTSPHPLALVAPLALAALSAAGWKLFGAKLHTGGFFTRTAPFGGIADGFHESHFYTANGRFVLDVLGKVLQGKS